jgi:hypothetical protein
MQEYCAYIIGPDGQRGRSADKDTQQHTNSLSQRTRCWRAKILAGARKSAGASRARG